MIFSSFKEKRKFARKQHWSKPSKITLFLEILFLIPLSCETFAKQEGWSWTSQSSAGMELVVFYWQPKNNLMWIIVQRIFLEQIHRIHHILKGKKLNFAKI